MIIRTRHGYLADVDSKIEQLPAYVQLIRKCQEKSGMCVYMYIRGVVYFATGANLMGYLQT